MELPQRRLALVLRIPAQALEFKDPERRTPARARHQLPGRGRRPVRPRVFLPPRQAQRVGERLVQWQQIPEQRIVERQLMEPTPLVQLRAGPPYRAEPARARTAQAPRVIQLPMAEEVRRT